MDNATSLLLLSLFVFLLIKALRKSKLQKPTKKLPPSPPKLPIIGHLHHVVGRLPHLAFKRIAEKHGPVLHLHLGEVPVVLISSREASQMLLKVQDPCCGNRPESIGSKALWYDGADIFFSPCDDYWKQMRKICVLELLSARNIKSFGSIRQDEASRLIQSLRSSCGESINMTEKLFAFTNTIICRCAFGKVMQDRDVLMRIMSKTLSLAGGFELADLFPSSKLLNFVCRNNHKLSRMRGKLDVILDNILEEHKLKQGGEFGSEDVVDALLRLKGNTELEFPITNENMKAVILDIFTGGTATSSDTIVWAMTELMRNPRVMAKVQAQVREAFKGQRTLEESEIQSLKYLKFVIKETFRLHPPIPLLPRSCRDECAVDGYTIPVNSKVIFNVWSMGRDPKYWDQPEIFLPERFEHCSTDFVGTNLEFIPFGAGRRICPGMDFGLMNIELILAQLLYHFDWKLPGGMIPDDIDMGEAGGLTVSRKSHLFLVPTLHNNVD